MQGTTTLRQKLLFILRVTQNTYKQSSQRAEFLKTEPGGKYSKW